MFFHKETCGSQYALDEINLMSVVQIVILKENPVDHEKCKELFVMFEQVLTMMPVYPRGIVGTLDFFRQQFRKQSGMKIS